MANTMMGTLAAQDTYEDPWTRVPLPQPLPPADDTGVYRGYPRLDVGGERAIAPFKETPQAQAIRETLKDFVVPQTPFDYALALAGPAGKLPKMARLGAIGLGALFTPSEAEAGPASKIIRGASHWSPFSKIAQPSPVAETAFTTRPTSAVAEKMITPSDLEGARLLPLVGDRTASGAELTGIGGRTFDNPTVLQGGHGYIKDMGEQGAVWASDKSPITTLLRRSKEAGDDPLFGVYTAMGHRAGDFSHHASDTLMSMVGNSKITQKGAQDFNTAMRDVAPGWPGLRSERARQWLAEQPGVVRSSFTKLMDTAQFRDAGFPRVDQARFAVTDPRLVDARTGSSGLSVGSISGDRVNTSNITPHRTYRDVMGGSYAGGFGQSVPFEVMYPDLAARYLKARPDMRKMTPDQLDAAFVSMATKGPRKIPYTQQATPQWVDSVSQYLERARMGDLARQDAY